MSAVILVDPGVYVWLIVKLKTWFARQLDDKGHIPVSVITQGSLVVGVANNGAGVIPVGAVKVSVCAFL